MKNGKLSKEERRAKKLARQQNRQNIMTMLTTLQGKDIMAMNDNQLRKTIVVLCDYVGISQKGIIQ